MYYIIKLLKNIFLTFIRKSVNQNAYYVPDTVLPSSFLHHLYSQVSGGWKTEIRVPAWLGFGKSPFSWLADRCLLAVCSRGGERASKVFSVSSQKSTSPMMRAPSDLSTSPKPHLQTPSHHRLGLQHVSWADGVYNYSVHNTV